MENKEKTIRLSDLIALLMKWFICIIFIALAFAIIGAVLSIRSQQELYNENSNVTQSQLDRSRQAFSEAQLALLATENALYNLEEIEIPALSDRITWTGTSIIQLKNHIENSLLMVLNPYSCPEARLSFYLKSEKLPSFDYLEVEESKKISSGKDFEISLTTTSVRSLWPLDLEMLEEVRDILNVDAELLYISEIATISYDPSTGFTVIKVCNNDIEAAKEAADYLFASLKKQLDKTIGSYQIITLGSFCGTIADLEVKNDQMALISGLTELTKGLSDSETILSELRASIEDKKNEVDNAASVYRAAQRSLEEMERHFSNPRAQAAISRRAILRKAIFWGLIGGVIACVFLIGVGVFGKTLHNHNELISRYSFPLLGILPRKKKYLFEKLIRKLEGEGNYSFEAAAQTTAQSLLSTATDKSVCLVSSLGKNEAEIILPYLDGRFLCYGDILGEVDAVKALADFDSVVLVEKRGKSNIDIIDAEVNRLRTLGKEIVGVIVT